MSSRSPEQETSEEFDNTPILTHLNDLLADAPYADLPLPTQDIEAVDRKTRKIKGTVNGDKSELRHTRRISGGDVVSRYDLLVHEQEGETTGGITRFYMYFSVSGALLCHTSLRASGDDEHAYQAGVVEAAKCIPRGCSRVKKNGKLSWISFTGLKRLNNPK